jgi:hypothetical protein
LDGKEVKKIDVGKLPSGVYLLKTTDNETVKFIRL